MGTNLSLKRPGKLSVLLPALALLVGFLLVFAALNGYKYWSTREEFSTKVLTDLANRQYGRLDNFLKGVENQLHIIRDVGENGVLKKSSVETLNKKFIPLIKNQKVFSGIIFADSTGWEYFLYKDEGSWVTRIKKDGRFIFTRWKGPDRVIQTWQKPSDYDPRKRPWFTHEVGKVHWSAVYTFFQSGKPGITASISWKEPKNKQILTVCALDIPAGHMEGLLDMTKEDSGGGLPFLLDLKSNKIILGKARGFSQEDVNLDLLMRSAIDTWKAKGHLSRKPVAVTFESKQWHATFIPVDGASKDFWFGFIVPENLIVSDLKKTFFRFDAKDVLVAVVGGLLLVALFWKFGGLYRKDHVVEDPLMRLHDYIKEGEGEAIEFKSTVRTNLKNGKAGKEIELAWLKAVVAFLNSDGGVVLLGVDDTGRILGVGQDGFESSDRCLLHIKNLINQHIGAEFSNFINITLVDLDDKQVVMLEVEPSTKPVFLRIGKNEEFYVRTGPSSVKLTPSQTISYLQHTGKIKI